MDVVADVDVDLERRVGNMGVHACTNNPNEVGVAGGWPFCRLMDDDVRTSRLVGCAVVAMNQTSSSTFLAVR